MSLANPSKPEQNRYPIIGGGPIGRATAAHALRSQGQDVIHASRTKALEPGLPPVQWDARHPLQLHEAATECSQFDLTLGLPCRAAIWERDWTCAHTESCHRRCAGHGCTPGLV